MKLYIVTTSRDYEFPIEWYTNREDAECRRNSLDPTGYGLFYVAEATYGHKFLSVTQVSQFYNVPRNTVLNWIKQGNIKAFRIGSKWMIKAESLPSFNS